MTRKELQRAIGAMNDAIEYFDDRADADHDGEKYAGNTEMRLHRDLSEALTPLLLADNDWGQERD